MTETKCRAYISRYTVWSLFCCLLFYFFWYMFFSMGVEGGGCGKDFAFLHVTWASCVLEVFPCAIQLSLRCTVWQLLPLPLLAVPYRHSLWCELQLQWQLRHNNNSNGNLSYPPYPVAQSPYLCKGKTWGIMRHGNFLPSARFLHFTPLFNQVKPGKDPRHHETRKLSPICQISAFYTSV